MANVSTEENAGVNKAPVIIPSPVSYKQIEAQSGQKITACYQCEKCTNGCPLTFAMDIPPNQLIHYIHLGLLDEVLNSDTIWVCASCETCTTRCPNEIDIARVMDTLRQLSTQKGVKRSQKQSPVFHRAFLDSVQRFGRLHEGSMAVEYAFRSEGLKGLRKQMSLGLEMVRKGKIKFMPGRMRAGKQVKEIFRSAKRKQKS